MITLLKKWIPARIRRYLRSPYLLPRGYRARLARYERVALGGFQDSAESQIAILRADIHVLDKGLHRRDWEPGHSAISYENACRLYDRLTGGRPPASDVLRWADGILKEYRRRQSLSAAEVRPLAAPAAPAAPSPDAAARLVEARVSTRWFQDRRVSPEILESLVQAALQAPSSCNRQTLRIFASLDPDKTVDILRCFRGFTGFSPFIPCALVWCADLRPYAFPNEVFVPTLDTALATENALLMATAHGLSATLLTWGSRTADDEQQLRDLLDIPAHLEIVVGAACGYPDPLAVRPVRKSVAETLVLK